MQIRFIGALAIAAALSSVASAAGNIVQNGGWETGDFTDWTNNAGPDFVTTNPSYVHSGDYGLAWGAVGHLGTIDQELTTSAGAEYELSFWYSILDGPTNEIAAYVGGTEVYDAFDPTVGAGWINVTEDFTASSTSTDLEFGLRQDPGYSALDDISVTQISSSVPGPAALVPFVAASLATLRRRAKRS